MVKKYCRVLSLNIFHAFISKKNGNILKNFIDDLNCFREIGGIKKDLGKLLINSFYGRLGLNSAVDIINLKTNNLRNLEYGLLKDVELVKKRINRKTKSNVGVAACITSKARIKLYESFKEIERSGGRVLYCDTDSVFAAFDKKICVENRRLGKYIYFDTSKDDTVIRDAVFIAPKTYGLIMEDGREIIKMKGVRVGDVKFNDLKKKFYDGMDFFDVPSSNIFTKDLNSSILFFKKRIRLQKYNKRRWSKDQKYTYPYRDE